ncbi:MAG: hypothetical protein SVX28_09810 [Pseudomonadota bacterium]|nr:hypothetical protein [Pseudomonadota bacterium]
MFSTKLWDQIASSVAQQWVERLFSPVLLFWAGGVLAYITAHDPKLLLDFLRGLDTPLQIALAVGGLVGVAGSAAVVESMQLSALRLLEGYWPRWLHPLRCYLRERLRKRIEKWDDTWRKLGVRYTELEAEELETYAYLDEMLATYPQEKRLLPTRLGNCLRAAEDYAWRHYGLAIGVVWPRLWGVMPEGAQKEISEARKRLDTAVRFWLWSFLFLVWTVWAWWMIPLALLGMVWGYRQALEAAGVYGELLRAAFDIHRGALYKALRWPLPTNPAEEHQTGQQITDYLWRVPNQSTTPTFR